VTLVDPNMLRAQYRTNGWDRDSVPKDYQ